MMRKIYMLAAVAALAALPALAKKTIETNFRTALVMAYSPANNVYEDDNIRLEIYDEKLWAINKTARTIFIDYSQCFLMHNGTSYPMFDSAHLNEKKASKKNVSTSVEQFLSIAPATGTKQNDTFICNLAGGIYGKYTTTESPAGNFSEYEERLLSLLNEMINESLNADPKGKQYVGTASRHLTEDESVNNVGASIAYAFNKRSENWTPVALSTWVSDLYLAPYYVEMPRDLEKKEMRGFGVKKTEAAKLHIKADSPFEFDTDKSPLVVADWVGNYKKGMFSLQYTWVEKPAKIGIFKAIGLALATITTGGLAAAALVNNTGQVYKRELIFDGAGDDWGKMTYMDKYDLSKFDNKR